jgi:CheY-like chemotaxis protein
VPLRILIVDDNRDSADTLAELLRLWGHSVSVAYDGPAGLKAATREPPDCLILDIAMPGMDGYALARLIRQQLGLAKAKLMAVTAYSDPDNVRRVDEAGFDYRLTKPAEPAELARILGMIEQLVHLAGQTEQLARQNVALAERTEKIAERSEALAGETKELLREVKEELKEVKEDVREIKDELKEVKDKVDKQNDGEGWK